MLVQLGWGRIIRIDSFFLVFKNKERNYPIRGVPDNVHGVSFRTGPKVWIDTTVIPQCSSVTRVIGALPHGCSRVIFLDNCSGHNNTPELDQSCNVINTEVRYFSTNSTHFIQPCDIFVI